MTFTIERYDGTNWVEINTNGFRLVRGNGNNKLGPELEFSTPRDSSITANDQVRLKIDGVVEFRGYSKNSGKFGLSGAKDYVIRGRGYEVLDTELTLDLSSISPEDILSNHVLDGTSYTLSTSTATGITIDSYKCSNRTRKSIIRDLLDRTSYLLRIDSVNQVFYFEDKGDRGNYGSFDAQNDSCNVVKWTEDDLDTVINKAIVYGTQEGSYKATASDSTSISTYGEQKIEVNYRYIGSTTEAQNIANQLLVPDPLDNGRVRAANEKFDGSDLVNYEIDVIDTSKNISSTVVVEKQIVKPGQMDLFVGQGEDFSLKNYNRQNKSREDKNYPGADLTIENADNINHIGTSAPSDPKIGWLWIDTSVTPNELKRYNGTSWDIIATVHADWSNVVDDGNKPEDDADVTQDHANDIIWDGEPSNPQDGWVYYDSGSGRFFRYDGGTGTWDIVSDITATQNQNFSWIVDDGKKPDDNATKNSVFSQDSTPSGEDGDLWFDTANSEWKIYKSGVWQKASDVTSDKNQSFSWLTGAIDGTQINDDTVITRHVAASAITAAEIDAGTITANEISTLDLDTADLSVGNDNTDQIQYGSANSGADTIMWPSSDQTCILGTSNRRFYQTYIQELYAEYFETDEIRIDNSNSAQIYTIRPLISYDNVRVGTTAEPFDEVHANELYGTLQDLVFAEETCEVCGERFKEGEEITLSCLGIEEDGSHFVPMHKDCQSRDKEKINELQEEVSYLKEEIKKLKKEQR